MKIIAGLITKNAQDYLQQSIESYIDYVDKLVVIDDCSTDSTLDICSSFGNKVDIICDKFNRDKFVQRQAYVNYADHGDYIFCPDSDEVFTKTQMNYIIDLINNGNLTFFIQHINFWKRYDTIIKGHVWNQQQQRGFKKINGVGYTHYHHTVSYQNKRFLEYAKENGKAVLFDPVLRTAHYGWVKSSLHIWNKIIYYMRRDNPNCKNSDGTINESLVIEYASKHPFFSNNFSYPRYGSGGLYCCGSHAGMKDHLESYFLPHSENIQQLKNYAELGGIKSETKSK